MIASHSFVILIREKISKGGGLTHSHKVYRDLCSLQKVMVVLLDLIILLQQAVESNPVCEAR
jgi:hypothetical protein